MKTEIKEAIFQEFDNGNLDHKILAEQFSVQVAQVRGLHSVWSRRKKKEKPQSLTKPQELTGYSKKLTEILNESSIPHPERIVRLANRFGWDIKGIYASMVRCSITRNKQIYVLEAWSAETKELIPHSIRQELRAPHEPQGFYQGYYPQQGYPQQPLRKEDIEKIMTDKMTTFMKQQEDSVLKLENERLREENRRLEYQADLKVRDQQIQHLAGEIEELKENENRKTAPDATTQAIKSLETVVVKIANKEPLKSFFSMPPIPNPEKQLKVPPEARDGIITYLRSKDPSLISHVRDVHQKIPQERKA